MDLDKIKLDEKPVEEEKANTPMHNKAKKNESTSKNGFKELS